MNSKDIKDYINLYKSLHIKCDDILRLIELDLMAEEAKTEAERTAIYKDELHRKLNQP